MKVILVATIAAVLIAGCATPKFEEQMLKRGDFFTAYRFGAIKEGNPQKAKEFVANMKSQPDYSSAAFIKQLNQQASSSPIYEHDSTTELAMAIRQAEVDGLIAPSDAEEAKSLLIVSIDQSAERNPAVLTYAPLLRALPELSSPIAKIAIYKKRFEEMKSRRSTRLADLQPLLIASKAANDTEFQANIVDLASGLALKDLSALNATSSNISLNDLMPLLTYVNSSQDTTVETALGAILMKTKLSKSELSSPVLALKYAPFVKGQIATRTVKMALVIEPEDGALYEDLSTELKQKNEWLEIDDNNPAKLIVKKQRFAESPSTPTTGTEIVPDPNFSTLLFIPKNASVLSDYVTTEFRFEYSIDLSFGAKRGKNIRGFETAKRVECRNIRYQNVFGGVGAIGWYPNDRVQSFCQQSNDASVDTLRSATIVRIAREINSQMSTTVTAGK